MYFVQDNSLDYFIRWFDYTAFGRPVKDSHIIAIKTPLKDVSDSYNY